MRKKKIARRPDSVKPGQLKLFIETFRNVFDTYKAAQVVGMTIRQINYYLETNQAFAQSYAEAVKEYTEKLEGISRNQALEPKGTLERMFQLKSLKPLVYREKGYIQNVNVRFDADQKMDVRRRLARYLAKKEGVDIEDAEVVTGDKKDGKKTDLSNTGNPE